jgi:hypothetical protein
MNGGVSAGVVQARLHLSVLGLCTSPRGVGHIRYMICMQS